MSQHDYTILNDTFPNVRADLNAALQAIASQSSGSSAPSTTFAYQRYADTVNGLMLRRNAANSAWKLDSTLAESMVQAKSTNYTVVVSDFQTLINCTSALTLSLTAAASLDNGFWFLVRNSSTGAVIIDPNSTEQINGATSITIDAGGSALVYCTGSAFLCIGGSKAPTVQTFTSSGTWTKPEGLRAVVVEVVGAGGGGAGGVSSTAAGGAGGTSSFGAHASATGGGGGIDGSGSPANAGGAGGSGASGDVNVAGSGGSGGSPNGSTDSNGGGAGGSSVLGGGARGGAGASTGGVYGGGGAGGGGVGASSAGGGGGGGGYARKRIAAASLSSTEAVTVGAAGAAGTGGANGGAGAAGLIIVTEFY
jgi:hypothetical protein